MPSTRRPPLPQELVLIVEADLAIREALRDILAAEGYKIETAERGVAALRRLSAKPTPGLLLFDLSPRRPAELDALCALRAHPRWGQLPVVVMTTQELHADLGCPVLSKPFTVRALLRAVRAALQQPDDSGRWNAL